MQYEHWWPPENPELQVKNDNLWLYKKSVLTRPVNCKHQGWKRSLNNILKGQAKKKILKKNILSPWNFGSNIGLFHFHSKRLSSRRQNQLSGKNYRGKIFPSCLFLFSKVRGFTSQTQELALPAFLINGIILTLKSWLDDTKSTMSNIQMT